MKKNIGILLILLLLATLAGCSGEQTAVLDLTNEEPVTYSAVSQSDAIGITVYLYTGSGIIADTASELDPDWIISRLADHLVIPDTVKVLSFSDENNKLQIDFNQALSDHITSMSSYGESLTIHCVVNTFLDAYNAESMSFTVEGMPLSTESHTYDYPQTYIRNYMD